MARLAAGELTPLIHARWPVAEAGRAMKCMQGARHIGKIVFTNSPFARGRLREDRSYLVTGGLGGIGIAVAGWARRARCRRHRAQRPAAARTGGRRGDRSAPLPRGHRAGGARDVTDAAALDAMLARMDADLPPLGGVIHSVGVLADATIGNQTWETFETVLWPKMLGAWHLHRATATRDLDMFVLFSSVAGVLGNPGQVNHAAANAFLDQLRRPPARARPPRPGHRLGRLVGDRRSRGAARADDPAFCLGQDRVDHPRSRGSGPSTGWCVRTPPPASCLRATGWPSASPWRPGHRCWRMCSPTARTTSTMRPRPKTCSPGCGRRQRQPARTCWGRSCRERSRPCCGCRRRRRPPWGSSISAWIP